MKIKGLGVAMITPFKNDLSIDFDSLGNLTESLVLGGVDFLVVMGTTGEAATLTVEEKQKVLSHVIKTNAGRVPVVYGIGGNNTAAVCEELRNFKTKGVSSILSASPGYNKPTQEGIFQHFKALGESTPLPIILYNVPGRTASNMEAKTSIRIASEVPNIVAIKEASGDLNQIEEIIRNAPEGFDVFSGDDGLTIPVMKAGGIGVISVIGNACPDLFSSLVRFCESKEYESAAVIFNVMEEIIPMLFEQGNPAGIKALMELHDMCTDKVRLPLVSANQLLKSRFKASLDALSSIV